MQLVWRTRPELTRPGHGIELRHAAVPNVTIAYLPTFGRSTDGQTIVVHLLDAPPAGTPPDAWKRALQDVRVLLENELDGVQVPQFGSGDVHAIINE
jgi:hypothetical protein